MLDPGLHEFVADDFQHRHELAEDEDLMPLVAELLEPLEERVELGARKIAVRGVDEGGMAADLAQAQEAREDIEAHRGERLVRFDAEELGAGALELGVVEAALL